VRYGIALWPNEAYHWTLTLPPQVTTPEFAFQILPKLWDNLRKECQRKLPDFHYAAFVELHPHRAGIAHFHIVSLHKSPYRLKDLVHHQGFGYMATESLIEGKKAAYYVSKYTSKQGEEMPKGFRRVRLDRAWPRLPDPIPEFPVLPMRKEEPLGEYLLRISRISHITTEEALRRWGDRDSDIG